VTMNTPLAEEDQPPSATSLSGISMPVILDTGLAADNAGVAATIKSGPCHFRGCESTSGHICQGSCGFYVCITCCDEILQLQPGAYYCKDCFNELTLVERVGLCHE
jgi:hypothetical protein